MARLRCCTFRAWVPMDVDGDSVLLVAYANCRLRSFKYYANVTENNPERVSDFSTLAKPNRERTQPRVKGPH